MNDYIVGHIRTFVPILVGWVIVQLVNWGVDITDDQALITGITGGVIALYYAVVRALAEKWPGVGIFLGVNKAPEYGG
jgi:hypothetical protein